LMGKAISFHEDEKNIRHICISLEKKQEEISQ